MDLQKAIAEAEKQSREEADRVILLGIDKDGDCELVRFTQGMDQEHGLEILSAYKNGHEVPVPEKARPQPTTIDDPRPSGKGKKKGVANPDDNSDLRKRNNKPTLENDNLDNNMVTEDSGSTTEAAPKKAAKKSAKKAPAKKSAKKAAPKKAAKKKAGKGERTPTPVEGKKAKMSVKQIRKAIKDGKVVRKPSGWYFSEANTKDIADQDRVYDVVVK